VLPACGWQLYHLASIRAAYNTPVVPETPHQPKLSDPRVIVVFVITTLITMVFIAAAGLLLQPS